MVAIAAHRADYGARILLIAALAGVLVSLYKYFDPASGINDTPGALLVIITSGVTSLIGLLLSKPYRQSTMHSLITIVCFVLIAGTAFAAYLLESIGLLVLMVVCLVGLVMHRVHRSDVAKAGI